MARIVVLSLGLLGLTGCASLYNYDYVAVGADYWAPELNGEVDAGDLLVTGNVDVQDDLDIGDEEIVNVHGAVQIWNFTLDASYFNVDYSGDNVLSQNIKFGDQTFTVGTNVNTDFEMQYASAKRKAGLLALGPVVIGALVGVNYFDLEGEVNTVLPVISAEENLEAPFPVIGAVVTADIPLGDTFAVFGDVELSGLYVDAYDIEGLFYDASAKVGLQASLFRVGGGYRFMQGDLEDTDEDFQWDFDLGGPFVFAEIAF